MSSCQITKRCLVEFDLDSIGSNASKLKLFDRLSLWKYHGSFRIVVVKFYSIISSNMP